MYETDCEDMDRGVHSATTLDRHAFVCKEARLRMCSTITYMQWIPEIMRHIHTDRILSLRSASDTPLSSPCTRGATSQSRCNTSTFALDEVIKCAGDLDPQGVTCTQLTGMPKIVENW